MCKICERSDRAEIDEALEQGGTIRNIATRFLLSPTTLHRYDAEHRIRRAILRERFVEGSEAPDLIADAHRRITRIMRRAMNVGSLQGADIALKALKERREYLAYERPPVQRTKDETPRHAWDSLSPVEKKERLAEARFRLGELEAEVKEGAEN
jgi:hypothetical protein